ncbi:MAG: hypothetical protein ABRQ39_22505 [Candidatus Eremiobacterota bacterium]
MSYNLSSYSTNDPEDFSSDWDKPEEKRSLTFEILNLFVQKLTTPEMYEQYELTLKQFDSSLDFFERKISDSLYKVTKNINIDEEHIEPDVEKQVKLQYNYCIDGGELFLEAIDEMRYYIDHIMGISYSFHAEECDWVPQEHLTEGLKIAEKADVKIRKSLQLFDTLYYEEE